jgi:energy-coupling factor transport system ATP-binding protein
VESPALVAPLAANLRTAANDPASNVALVDRLSVVHGDVVAVAEASFDLRVGEIVALIGPNGAGKSSLLDALARPTESGRVVVAGRDVRSLGRRDRRRAVALVPEDVDDLFSATTVKSECRRADRLAAISGTAELFVTLLGAAGPAAARRRTLLDSHPRDLSAGERLCLAIALQLSARPNVLLIDEPSRGLDATSRDLVAAALRAAAAAGTAVILATHDRAFAARCATRTLTMDAGVLREEAVVAR